MPDSLRSGDGSIRRTEPGKMDVCMARFRIISTRINTVYRDYAVDSVQYTAQHNKTTDCYPHAVVLIHAQYTFTYILLYTLYTCV